MTPYGLRSRLRHLAATERLAVIHENVSPIHELAAIAKKFDGKQVTGGRISGTAWP